MLIYLNRILLIEFNLNLPEYLGKQAHVYVLWSFRQVPCLIQGSFRQQSNPVIFSVGIPMKNKNILIF